MQWISVSDYSIIYGFCEKKSHSDTVSRIFKKNLMISADSVSYLQEVKKHFKSIFAFFEHDKPTDRKVAITIPTNKSRIYLNTIDSGLNEDDINDVLNQKINNSLPTSDKLFLQHYHLESEENIEYSQYLTLAISEELRKVIIAVALEYDFNPVLMDLGLFSAYKLLSKSFPVQAYEKWGVWNIGKENESQNLLIFNQGIMSFISFAYDKNFEITVFQNSDPEKFDNSFFENLINKNYSSLNFDKFFVYTNSPNNIFVQNQVDTSNQIILNPLPILSQQKVHIEQKYLSDKLGVSQFSEISGLITRF